MPQETDLENYTDWLYRRGLTYDEAIRTFKKAFLLTSLRHCSGNQCRAARKIGVHRNTLGRLLSEFEIDPHIIRQALHPSKPAKKSISAVIGRNGDTKAIGSAS